MNLYTFLLNPQVSIVHETRYIQPTRTAVSVFTSFSTETERKDLLHTVTHVALHHEVRHEFPANNVTLNSMVLLPSLHSLFKTIFNVVKINFKTRL